MVDGIDVLFRVALAILRSNEQELLACESIPAVYVALESLPNRMWKADKLIKVRDLNSKRIHLLTNGSSIEGTRVTYNDRTF